MKRSFFVRNRRKRYGCEMPARRAISSVEPPAKPFSAKTSRAASRTAWRRSSAVFLGLSTAMTRCKLSLTHNCCQGLRDPVELRVGQPRVQRQRERPLEAAVRPGEAPLVAVGREPVQRVGADLALDPL